MPAKRVSWGLNGMAMGCKRERRGEGFVPVKSCWWTRGARTYLPRRRSRKCLPFQDSTVNQHTANYTRGKWNRLVQVVVGLYILMHLGSFTRSFPLPTCIVVHGAKHQHPASAQQCPSRAPRCRCRSRHQVDPGASHDRPAPESGIAEAGRPNDASRRQPLSAG